MLFHLTALLSVLCLTSCFRVDAHMVIKRAKSGTSTPYNPDFPNNNAYNSGHFIAARRNLFVPSNTSYYYNMGFKYQSV